MFIVQRYTVDVNIIIKHTQVYFGKTAFASIVYKVQPLYTIQLNGQQIIQPTSPKTHNVVFSLEFLLMDLYSLDAGNYESQKYIALDKSKLTYYTDLEQCIFFTYSVEWGSKTVLLVLHNRAL